MNILVTGGAGYIGSHTVRALLGAGHQVVIVDNLSRGHKESIPTGVPFYEMDITDPALGEILDTHKIDGIMHFAAHSQVGESMVNPSIYYENNVVGSYRLVETARKHGVNRLVFSSTAAVYGEPEVVPITEDAKWNPTNVYGRTKLMIAAGADPSGEIGEDHTPETHLIPLIIDAALGKRESITVFGTDYDTADGTCVRDYVHVNDLASAHILAMEYLYNGGESDVFNLGSGNGFSVNEIVAATKEVTGVDFRVDYGERRAGDPGTLIASSEKIHAKLGWKPVHSTVQEVIRDAWNWHQLHPKGY